MKLLGLENRESTPPRFQFSDVTKSQSVKDLASRFEQIMKSSATTGEVHFQTSHDGNNDLTNKTDEHVDDRCHAVSHDEKTQRRETDSSRLEQCGYANQNRCQQPTTDIPVPFCPKKDTIQPASQGNNTVSPIPHHLVQNGAASPSAFVGDGERTEIRRPERPPDYETAIQRLGMIRDRSNCSTPVDGIPSLGKQEADETSRKKRGPKKTVTFSDQVVLVACADDEDAEFIPNPLLERVYKQHLMQQGGPPPNGHTNAPVESCCEQQQPFDPSRMMAATVPCHLCNKHEVTPPTVYCPDCAFYMSRFQPRQ